MFRRDSHVDSKKLDEDTLKHIRWPHEPDKLKKSHRTGAVSQALMAAVFSTGLIVSGLPISADNTIPKRPAYSIGIPGGLDWLYRGNTEAFSEICAVVARNDTPRDMSSSTGTRSSLLDENRNIKIPNVYTHDVLKEHLSLLKERYPSLLKLSVIGKSVMDKDLDCIKLGDGPNKVLIIGTFHAREVITTQGLMEFINRFLEAASKPGGGCLYGNYNVLDIMEETSMYIIPMLNPDGVQIIYDGMTSDYPAFDIFKNRKINWARYKANANGVDLNNQWPRRFEEYKKDTNTPKGPATERWCGPAPLSEPESKALADFTLSLKPSVALSIHCTGSKIFCSNLKEKAILDCGMALEQAGGYKLTHPENDRTGYVDWLAAEFKKFGILPYTIEVGNPGESAPLPVSRLYGEDGIMNNLTPIIITGAVYNTPLWPSNSADRKPSPAAE